jgi:hypothetical protein
VRIQCGGAIVNAGLIAANGVTTTNGSGAGGGIVILASSTSIENTGTLSATGSNGSAARVDASTFPTFVGAGGGGGGGIVVLAAPDIRISAGFIDVNGGLAGNHLITSTQPRRFGGSGGGAAGGRGGNGGAISESGGTMTGQPAQAGDDGYFVLIPEDPSFLPQ